MQHNLTQKIARKAALRPRTVIAIWSLVFAISVLLILTLLGGAMTTQTSMSDNPESVQANHLLADRLGNDSEGINEVLIIQSPVLTVDDVRYRQFVEKLYSGISALGNEAILSSINYYQTPVESLVSEDRHSLLIPLVLTTDGGEAIDPVYRLIDTASANPSFEVFVTGDATIKSDSLKMVSDVLRTGESIGITMAMIILALVFGTLAAALLPIILAIVVVVVSLGAASLLGQTVDFFFIIQNMITMMGLAVGIDYSLFILSRYREERERGLDTLDAISKAGATASRAVMFSGFTVILALVGLVIFPSNIFWSAGVGAILAVLVAVIASATLLPAVLGLFGDNVNRLRLPFFRGGPVTDPALRRGGFWVRVSRIVMRQPVASLIFSIGLLLAITVPYFEMEKGASGVSALPDELKSKQGFIALQDQFGWGQDEPAVVVIDGETDSTAVQSGIAKLKTLLASDDLFISSQVEMHPEEDLTLLHTRLAGDPLGRQAMESVLRLRQDYIPQAFGMSSVDVMVTGETARTLDFNTTTDTYTPIVFAIVLSLSFVLLTLAFRSIVIPIKSILMNLLSVGAAYGAIVLVFQKGVGASLLGFRQVEVIENWLPLFLFAILFGLSMDYHVFLISRIKERFVETGRNRESVAFGLRSTGKLITGAALIMVAVFGGFALGDMSMFQQLGFGLAIAILIDATLVRSMLLPATMRILGKWNWYFPKWLEWIPNINVG